LAKDLRFIELSGKDNRGLSFVSWLDNNIRVGTEGLKGINLVGRSEVRFA